MDRKTAASAASAATSAATNADDTDTQAAKRVRRETGTPLEEDGKILVQCALLMGESVEWLTEGEVDVG